MPITNRIQASLSRAEMERTIDNVLTAIGKSFKVEQEDREYAETSSGGVEVWAGVMAQQSQVYSLLKSLGFVKDGSRVHKTVGQSTVTVVVANPSGRNSRQYASSLRVVVESSQRSQAKVEDPKKVVLRADEYWHGGSFATGRPNPVLYCTKDLVSAMSYVDMCKDRGVTADLIQLRVKLLRAAPQQIISQVAQKYDVEDDGTPASIFDTQLHGPNNVRNLVYGLTHLGYDHAVLDDIAYGIQRELSAYVLFLNVTPKIINRFKV